MNPIAAREGWNLTTVDGAHFADHAGLDAPVALPPVTARV